MFISSKFSEKQKIVLKQKKTDDFKRLYNIFYYFIFYIQGA